MYYILYTNMLYNMYNAHIEYGKADFKIRRIGEKEVTPL